MSADPIEDRILDAAARLIAHYGYDKTTMNDIAREADIGKSTIYLRWKKRDDLMRTLIWRESKCYIDAWTRLLEASTETLTFAVIFRSALQALYDNPFMMRLYVHDRAMLGRVVIASETTELYTRRMALVEKLYRDFQAVGFVRSDLDPYLVAYLTNSLQYGLLQMSEILSDQSSKLSPTDMLDGVFELIDRYVEPDEPPVDQAAGKRIIQQYINTLRQQLDQLEAISKAQTGQN